MLRLVEALSLLLCGLVCFVSGLSVKKYQPTRVLVTGAGSSVGFFVFKKLLRREKKDTGEKLFYPLALVRNQKDITSLLSLGASPEQIILGDITDKESLSGCFKDVDKVVLCTSSAPRKKTQYKVLNFFKSLVGQGALPAPTDLYYAKKESPYDVDFLGQKHVIDEAVESKVEHIVMLSNMGGYRGSKLNDIGREQENADSKAGNILKWKRAAERYLMKRCFFTIIHGATLTNEKGGQREVIWDNDDALLRTSYRRIPREDVAEALVQALMWKEAIGRSIDVAARQEGTGPTDWLRFWSRPGNNVYPADLD